MESKHSFALISILRRNKRTKEGLVPVYLRISVDCKRSEVSTRTVVPAEKWIPGHGRVKGNSEESKRLNLGIIRFEHRAREIYHRFIEQGKIITAEIIKNELLGTDHKQRKLLEQFKLVVKDTQDRINLGFAAGTVRNWVVTEGHLEEFLLKHYQVSDITFKQLDRKFIADFEWFARTNWACGNNAALKHIQRIRKVVKKAVSNNWLLKDPFMGFEGKQSKTHRTFLTDQELEAYDLYFKHTAFTINPESHQSFENLDNGNTHVLDWLAQNNMNDEVCTTLTKHISLSILSDFVNFVYESLSCAKKGKITVAYSLLRKPFTDELLILEQLLSSKEDFIQKFFYNGDPEHYDPASRNIRRNKKEKEIIENAIQNLSLDRFLSPEIIYNIRYDKSFVNGINGISNKALHIVTTDNNYKTLNQNLNFIFSSGPEHYEKHCEHFFFFVPILLIYSAAIADELLFQYLPEEENKIEKVLRAFKRLVAYSFLNDMGAETLLDALSAVLQYECKDCNHNKNVDKADYELFLRTGLFICDKCFKPTKFTLESIDLLRDLISFKNDNCTAL